MSDICILKPLLNKSIYNKYNNILFNIPSLQKELVLILNTIKKYYKKYTDKDQITLDELKLYIFSENPTIKPDIYNVIFETLKESQIYNEDLIIRHLNRLSEKATFMG